MPRIVCLAVVLSGLVASSGCSSCLGGAGCRRPSFMEFRSPCGQRSGSHAPLFGPVFGPAAAPAYGPSPGPSCGQPCGPSYGPACEPMGGCGPCSEGGMGMGGMGGVIMEPTPAIPVGEPGTFS